MLSCGCVYATATKEAFEDAGLTFDPRVLGPQKDPEDGFYFKAYGHGGAPWWLPKSDWDANDEDAYNMDTDKFDARKIVTRCPTCNRQQAPLLSPCTRLLYSDWRWVGIEYKEPFSEWVARCRTCKTVFRFVTHTPQ